MFVDSGKLFLPSQLALNYGNVTHAGPVSDVAEAVRNVRELDLSNNKITQWREACVSTQSSYCIGV